MVAAPWSGGTTGVDNLGARTFPETIAVTDTVAVLNTAVRVVKYGLTWVGFSVDVTRIASGLGVDQAGVFRLFRRANIGSIAATLTVESVTVSAFESKGRVRRIGLIVQFAVPALL